MAHSSGRSGAALLALLVIVCFMLITLSARSGGRASVADRLFLSFTGPVIRFTAAPRKWTAGIWHQYMLLQDTQKENLALKEQLKTLRVDQSQIKELKSEVARLRRLLGASKSLAAPVRLARIVARGNSIYGESLTVNLGSADGVRKNMPVMHEAGLVGRISRVGHHVSQVLPLLDTRSSVGVIAQRTRAQGIFSISEAGESEVLYMAAEPGVRVGDPLISSGLGGIFPKGLPVARVTEIDGRKGLFPRIKAKPMVNFTTMEEVMIMMVEPAKSLWK